MLAASDYLTASSTVSGEVDPDRVAVLGFSMGGGGAPAAAEARHTLKTVVALMPFDVRFSYAGGSTPTLIMTGRSDRLAFPLLVGKRMYQSAAGVHAPAVPQLTGADHFAGQRTPNDTIRDAVTAFLDRYLDGDESATARICPASAATSPISESMSYFG
jgi:dienelactone hydrolase